MESWRMRRRGGGGGGGGEAVTVVVPVCVGFLVDIKGRAVVLTGGAGGTGRVVLVDWAHGIGHSPVLHMW